MLKKYLQRISDLFNKKRKPRWNTSYLRRITEFEDYESPYPDIRSASELMYHQTIFYPFNMPPFFNSNSCADYLSTLMKELGYQHIEFYELSVNPEEAQAPYFLEKVYMIINNRYGAVIYINNRANFMFRIPLET